MENQTLAKGKVTTAVLERFSSECRKAAGFALATPHDWLKKLAPHFHHHPNPKA